MVYKGFDKKVSGSGIKNENISNKELPEVLQKQFLKRSKKRRVYSSFIANIQGVDLTSMQLISNFNKGIRFLLGVTDIFSKYAWVIPLKDKKGVTITNDFEKILDESYHRTIKIKPDDVKPAMYIDFNKKDNKEPLGKITSRIRPEGVPKRHPIDVSIWSSM